MDKQKVIVPTGYDEFANRSFDEKEFEKLFNQETKEELESNLNDELPI